MKKVMLCLAKEKAKREIRYTTEEDLPAILQMALEEGWISDLIEFQIFIELNPFSCFVYVEDGKVVGSIMTFQHSQSAWIGNFVVSRERRGRGIGRELLTRAINCLEEKKKKQIFLNAACGAEGLYEKFGFKKVMPVSRWRGKAAKSVEKGMNFRRNIPDIFNFLKVDTSLWKDERFSLITQLSLTRCICFHYKPSGFLMYGKAGRVVIVGPWELENGDEKTAEKLFTSGLSELEPQSEVLLDVPSVNKKAERILSKHNFEVVSSTLFMCRGKLPKINFDGIFSFATMGSMG